MLFRSPKLSLFISLSRQIIILIPCIIVMSRLFGLTGIWFAAPTSDFISTEMCIRDRDLDQLEVAIVAIKAALGEKVANN